MKVLLLGPERPSIEACIRSYQDSMVRTEDPLALGDPVLNGVEFIVSYGYRHLIRPEVLARFGNRAVNLHVSMLPWNRGADPNLWSFLEDTPKGVTIHVLDAGLDTGPIIAQREVAAEAYDTLRTSYLRLCVEVEMLFCELWPAMRADAVEPVPQKGEGTLHRVADRLAYESLLTHGWETPVAGLTRKALGG